MSSVPGRDASKPENQQEASRVEKDLGQADRLAQRLGYKEPVVESPRWAVMVRQAATFLLGIWILVYSVTASSKNIIYIITGLILIGIIPIERMLEAVSRSKKE
jgi:hypothetical protein